MENSTLTPQKRSIELPSPSSLAHLLNFSHKRQRLPSVPRSLNDANSPKIGNESATMLNMEQNLSHGVNQVLSQWSHINLPLPPLMHRSRSQTPSTEAPLLHSVPTNIIPILQPTDGMADFYSDITTDMLDPRLRKQISGIVNRFPPPFPPFIPPPTSREVDDDEEDDEDDDDEDINQGGGIMAPFIYPPPPIINIDTLPYSIESFKRKWEESAREASKNVDPNTSSIIDDSRTQDIQTRRKTRKSTGDEANDKSQRKPNLIYPHVPPLPFPPPNYMPYPLIAEKAALTPDVVFSSFIEANDHLPRIDMVLASAAGSLFDLRSEATETGFTIEEHELQKKLNKLNNSEDSDYEDKDQFHERIRSTNEKFKQRFANRNPEESDGEYDDGYEDYLEYMQGIKTNNYYDYFDKKRQALPNNSYELNQMPPQFAMVEPRLSNIKNTKFDQVKLEKVNDSAFSANSIDNQSFLPILPSMIVSNPGKDIILGNGNNKEKRRSDLAKTVQELEEFQETHRREIYESKKLELMKRLQNLQNSKISFTDSKIYDDELLKYQEDLEISRDEELLRLKLVENYELLKNSLFFYQDSNRVYKNLNLVMINKLEKLKNFFEYQRNLFTSYLENKNQDIFDIKNKESIKLFNGTSSRDYGREIKDLLRKSLENDLGTEEVETLFTSANTKLTLSASSTSSRGSSAETNKAAVHDFMPLVTPSEFNVITGNLPVNSKSTNQLKENSKGSGNNKSNINIKHQIFQNPLYDRMTSGSDTNASDSNNGVASSSTSKRRARRGGAGNTVNSPAAMDKFKGDGPESKYSEAVLLAKIMKQFSGPQGAKVDELNYDLQTMGLSAK